MLLRARELLATDQSEDPSFRRTGSVWTIAAPLDESAPAPESPPALPLVLLPKFDPPGPFAEEAAAEYIAREFKRFGLNLNRGFHDLGPADLEDQDGPMSRVGSGRLKPVGWPEVLQHPRVLLLSEAGSGKTMEMRAERSPHKSACTFAK